MKIDLTNLRRREQLILVNRYLRNKAKDTLTNFSSNWDIQLNKRFKIDVPDKTIYLIDIYNEIIELKEDGKWNDMFNKKLDGGKGGKLK